MGDGNWQQNPPSSANIIADESTPTRQPLPLVFTDGLGEGNPTMQSSVLAALLKTADVQQFAVLYRPVFC